MNLTNNIILVTGGTSGFGLEFTKQLLDLGNTLIITGRNQDKLDETKKMFPTVHTFQSDVDPKTLLDADKLVATAIKGLENDTFEIYPGVAKAIRVISRIAPKFLLKQLSKPVDKMLNI
jgi:short-subunit dehydrogenase